MKIFPQPGIVYLRLNKAEAGDLDLSNRASAVEFAEVLAVGEGGYEDCIRKSGTNEVYGGGLKKGDKVFVKSWGIDSISHEGETYTFVNLKTDAILAIVR